MSLAGRWPADLIGGPAPDLGDLAPAPDAVRTEHAAVLDQTGITGRERGAGVLTLARRVGASPPADGVSQRRPYLTRAEPSRCEPDMAAFKPVRGSIGVHATDIHQLTAYA